MPHFERPLNTHSESLAQATALRDQARISGQTVVFTNGCFDVIHAGHVAYLAWAKSQGDVLIVGVNDDASVKKLKGEFRPVVPFAERCIVLSALRAVDLVVGFSESTPEYVIDALGPDIHVKSSQYRLEDLPERAIVESHGGKVVLAPHIAGVSTTDIVARILQMAK